MAVALILYLTRLSVFISQILRPKCAGTHSDSAEDGVTKSRTQLRRKATRPYRDAELEKKEEVPGGVIF